MNRHALATHFCFLRNELILLQFPYLLQKVVPHAVKGCGCLEPVGTRSSDIVVNKLQNNNFCGPHGAFESSVNISDSSLSLSLSLQSFSRIWSASCLLLRRMICLRQFLSSASITNVQNLENDQSFTQSVYMTLTNSNMIACDALVYVYEVYCSQI